MNYEVARVLEYSNLTFDNGSVASASSPETGPLPREDLEWTIVIPFYNEQLYLSDTIRSAASQSVRFDLILVDNGSVDSSVRVAKAECDRLTIPFRLLEEPRRGKVHALAAALSQVNTRFVATCDADTIYPPEYLAAAARIFRARPENVAAQAYYVSKHWSAARCLLASAKLIAASRLLPHQGHCGGAGQVFRADALRDAGGFDPRRWNLVLEDHEIIHRLTKFGRVSCAPDFWCCPGRHEGDDPGDRWSLIERLRYHFTPAPYQSQFFYEYLRPRLEARRSG